MAFELLESLSVENYTDTFLHWQVDCLRDKLKPQMLLNFIIEKQHPTIICNKRQHIQLLLGSPLYLP